MMLLFFLISIKVNPIGKLIDEHLQERPEDKGIVSSEYNSEYNNTNISNKNQENNKKIADQIDERDGQSSPYVSQASHVSPIAARESDDFHCYYCASFNTTMKVM
jgi:hypothetical protein